MGEQSNTLPIVLGNDRKSRHRRIKKQRRYERLAAQASYPVVTFLSLCVSTPTGRGSIGHAFAVCVRTGDQNQASLYPFVPREVSVLAELAWDILRYALADVPPQPNSPPGSVGPRAVAPKAPRFLSKARRDGGISGPARASHLCYTPGALSQCQTRVKLNRVFFPR